MAKRKARPQAPTGVSGATDAPAADAAAKRQKGEGGGRAPAPAAAPEAAEGAFKNKERVLLVSSRGITHRYRHLLLDFGQLLPHSKRDAKLDTKRDRGILNEVADMKGCQSVMFFEARKKKDLYIWLAKAPEGPSVKFLVTNVHTMAELKLSGNHLKGSRPLLSFHKAFDEEPHLQLLKELFTQAFGTPRRHAKSKPFIDHVLVFSVAEGRVWLRNYQMVTEAGLKGEAAAAGTSLVEAGPRACLQPIRIFAGSFGGPVLYENPAYVSPNHIRAALKRQRAGKYAAKLGAQERHKAHLAAIRGPAAEEQAEQEEAAAEGAAPAGRPKKPLGPLAARAAALLQESQAAKAWIRVGERTDISRSQRRKQAAREQAAAEAAQKAADGEGGAAAGGAQALLNGTGASAEPESEEEEGGSGLEGGDGSEEEEESGED